MNLQKRQKCLNGILPFFKEVLITIFIRDIFFR